MRLRVEVEFDRPAFALRLLVREDARGVVAADLHVAHALRRRTIPLVEDHRTHRLQAALVVGAHGHDHDHERIFLRRRDTDLRARTDQERTQIHRTARTVRRDEFLVLLDDLHAGVKEHVHRHRRHAGALGRAVHALRVLVRTENDDLAVLLAKALDALKALLPVVKAGRPDVHRDVGILDELGLGPLAVLPRVADVAVHIRETEAELRPFDFLLCFLLSHCISP